MTRTQGGTGAVIALALIATSCAHHRKAPEPASSSPAPAPPPAAPAPPPQTINSGLGAEESLWHVRSALNVAALLCGRQPGGAELVQRYNALLVGDKAVLATAYSAETRQHGAADPAALDRHMTQLYNFFAKPQYAPNFCTAAMEVSRQAASTPAAGLTAFAPDALARLQASVFAPAPPVAVAARMAMRTENDAGSGDWRIQLGAFTGRPAAEGAWAKVRAKLTSLAGYQPRYEAVPNSKLVRLQIGSATDRDGALKLCAAAATGGFDCMPVAKGR